MFLQNCDARLSRSKGSLCVRKRRPSLVLPRNDFLIVQSRDRIAGFDSVALSDPNFEDASARFRSDGRIVAFDSTAKEDDLFWNVICEGSPRQQQNDDCHEEDD